MTRSTPASPAGSGRRGRRRPRRRQWPGSRFLVVIAILGLVGTGAGFVASGGPSGDRDRPSGGAAADSPDGDPAPDLEPAGATPPAVPARGGPVRGDFMDIARAPRNDAPPPKGPRAGTGTFTADCGRNERGHHNSDNFITAPGVSNGAHHMHDYVGNRSTNGFSTDRSLGGAGTTCARGDRSAYFWPVLRVRGDNDTPDPEGNTGTILTPSAVDLEFRGNARSPVTAMPRFLRVVTGDAKAFTNGPGKARARWTCTGFEDRRLTERYPLCPEGSGVVRVLDFPGCWDGRNTDSPDHRDHMVFAGRNGGCPAGTRAVPQLRMTLAYEVERGALFALDTFPDQLHKPVTDHADFANMMPGRLMDTVVACINDGRACG